MTLLLLTTIRPLTSDLLKGKLCLDMYFKYLTTDASSSSLRALSLPVDLKSTIFPNTWLVIIFLGIPNLVDASVTVIFLDFTSKTASIKQSLGIACYGTVEIGLPIMIANKQNHLAYIITLVLRYLIFLPLLVISGLCCLFGCPCAL